MGAYVVWLPAVFKIFFVLRRRKVIQVCNEVRMNEMHKLWIVSQIFHKLYVIYNFNKMFLEFLFFNNVNCHS